MSRPKSILRILLVQEQDSKANTSNNVLVVDQLKLLTKQGKLQLPCKKTTAIGL